MSDNLHISRMSSSLNNPHVSTNRAMGEIDATLTEVLELTMEDADNYIITLTPEQFKRHSVFVLYQDIADYPHRLYLLIPDGVPRGAFVVRNMTPTLLQIHTVSQSNPLPISGGIPGGVPAWMPKCDIKAYSCTTAYSDGVSVMRAEAERHHNVYLETILTAQTIWIGYMGRYGWVYADDDSADATKISGWYARARVAPSGGNVSFDVKAKGSSIGSIDFANGVQLGKINLAPVGSIEGISDNEFIEIVSPANIYSMAGLAVHISLIG